MFAVHGSMASGLIMFVGISSARHVVFSCKSSFENSSSMPAFDRSVMFSGCVSFGVVSGVLHAINSESRINAYSILFIILMLWLAFLKFMKLES